MNGLCLSGGGIKAAAHIGAIKALEESGIKFDSVSGTSSGSIIATLYSLGYDSDSMFKIFKQYCTKIKYVEFPSIFKIIYGLIFYRKLIVSGLNSGKSIEKIVNKVCKEHSIYNISDIKMPLLIPFVDLKTGDVLIASSKEIRRTCSDDITYLTDIPISTAVRASCSYPGVISPCFYNKRQLVDGGIRENLPWKELKQIGAKRVLGIKFKSILDENESFDNIIEIASRSLDLVCHELSNYEIDGIDYLITIPFPKISLLDTSKVDELYYVGYRSAQSQLNKFKVEDFI